MITTFNSVLNSDEKKDKLTKIYEKYQGTMLMVAKGILSDLALAEDAVSDSILTIVKYLHKINDIDSYKTMAYISFIVRSRALDLREKQKNQKEQTIDDFNRPDVNADVLDYMTMTESYNNIILQIRSLPKTLSDTLYLSIVLGHSHEEISNILNLSNDAVRQRLSRAKYKIRKMFLKEGIQ